MISLARQLYCNETVRPKSGDLGDQCFRTRPRYRLSDFGTTELDPVCEGIPAFVDSDDRDFSAELPRFVAKSLKEARACLEIVDGFSMELVLMSLRNATRSDSLFYARR